MNVIDAESVVVEYRRPFRPPVRAVNGLSFSVREGETVGFIGVNGAGKTSTIKTIMGFQPASSGSLRVLGRSVGDVEARRSIGFLPETALYSPYLTPYETLRLYGELGGVPHIRHRIGELLESVGVGDKARTLNRHLSKGMLQRVGIAQALLGEPRLLILDELSSGLDPIGRRDLRRILEEQKQRGVTIFFSSHELSEVELLCDRVLVVHQGRLVAERAAGELRGRVTSLEDYFVTLVQTGQDPLEERAA